MPGCPESQAIYRCIPPSPQQQRVKQCAVEVAQASPGHCTHTRCRQPLMPQHRQGLADSTKQRTPVTLGAAHAERLAGGVWARWRGTGGRYPLGGRGRRWRQTARMLLCLLCGDENRRENNIWSALDAGLLVLLHLFVITRPYSAMPPIATPRTRQQQRNVYRQAVGRCLSQKSVQFYAEAGRQQSGLHCSLYCLL